MVMEEKVELTIQDFAIQFLESGNQKDFESLYVALLPKYTSHVKKLISNSGKKNISCHDIVHDTFTHAYFNIHTYNPLWNFNTWFYRIGMNIFIGYLNAQKDTISYNILHESGNHMSSNYDISDEQRLAQMVNYSSGYTEYAYNPELDEDEELQRKREEISNDIKVHLSKFTELEQEIFRLRVEENKTHLEISLLLGVNYQSVRTKFAKIISSIYAKYYREGKLDYVFCY